MDESGSLRLHGSHGHMGVSCTPQPLHPAWKVPACLSLIAFLAHHFSQLHEDNSLQLGKVYPRSGKVLPQGSNWMLLGKKKSWTWK
jgi:hypothetical protein